MSARSTCSSASSQPPSSVPSHPARAATAARARAAARKLEKQSLLLEINSGRTEVRRCYCYRTKPASRPVAVRGEAEKCEATERIDAARVSYRSNPPACCKQPRLPGARASMGTPGPRHSGSVVKRSTAGSATSGHCFSCPEGEHEELLKKSCREGA